MSGTNARNYRRLLESKLSELFVSTSNRDEIMIERSADELESLQQQLSREVVIRNLDRSSKLFKHVESALTRIDDETYGICLRCEEMIPEKRLLAIPWAAYCVDCQEMLDNDNILNEDDVTIH